MQEDTARRVSYADSDVENSADFRAMLQDSSAFSSLHRMQDILRQPYKREVLMADMREALAKGLTSYQTPLGEEARADFMELFVKMKKAVRRVTYEKLKEGAVLTDETIQEIIFAVPVEPPIYIDLRPGIVGGDGRKASPLTSTDDAEEALEKARRHGMLRDRYVAGTFKERPHAFLTCDPDHEDCELLPCSEPGCTKLVCREHGDGNGFYEEDPGCYRLHFPDRFCMVEGCKEAYCAGHMEDSRGLQRFYVCDVCRNGTCAEMALVGDPYIKPGYYLCDTHAVCCSGEHGDAGACDDDDDDEADGEDSEATKCGFICCPSCLHDHQCGYDPTEYV